jgi:hypothetical protein
LAKNAFRRSCGHLNEARLLANRFAKQFEPRIEDGAILACASPEFSALPKHSVAKRNASRGPPGSKGGLSAIWPMAWAPEVPRERHRIVAQNYRAAPIFDGPQPALSDVFVKRCPS